jgi:hypothetical protein
MVFDTMIDLVPLAYITFIHLQKLIGSTSYSHLILTKSDSSATSPKVYCVPQTMRSTAVSFIVSQQLASYSRSSGSSGSSFCGSSSCRWCTTSVAPQPEPHSVPAAGLSAPTAPLDVVHGS